MNTFHPGMCTDCFVCFRPGRILMMQFARQPSCEPEALLHDVENKDTVRSSGTYLKHLRVLIEVIWKHVIN